MRIEAYIRNKTAQYLRLLLIKNECEICKETKGLELHHTTPFAQLLEECMDSLGYEYCKNTKQYTTIELENITNWMLGVQLKTKYITVCEKCHENIHIEAGGFRSTTNKFDEYIDMERVRKKLLEEERIRKVIIPYLESIVGTKLYKEEQKELEEVFESNGLKGRTFGLNSLNKILVDRKILYVANIGKRNKYRDSSGKVKSGKSHWILSKV